MIWEDAYRERLTQRSDNLLSIRAHEVGQGAEIAEGRIIKAEGGNAAGEVMRK